MLSCSTEETDLTHPQVEGSFPFALAAAADSAALNRLLYLELPCEQTSTTISDCTNLEQACALVMREATLQGSGQFMAVDSDIGRHADRHCV